ncbi:LeuD/DmdB family oxidoreductase small subunit [Nocardia aurantiaca]|uniref:3-isopropylmalate dehydratase small subunit n=1 Tax=Nocardia aurantiaca TaxID=2675850 RepID=A0A6I3L7X0_9NOCA|nr:3-isopropylmalate dehydratase [Nocardia aurantiaca]MTE16814.1 3-isopropylmalate dehydratase [Nocardia aurantiaca]
MTTNLSNVTGRAWIFGDAVDTDDMYPGFALKLPFDQAARHMFNASRPDWPTQVRSGDIVVGGRNFGIGSSRPVAMLFKELGIAAVVAEQFNSLFYRNCINYGLPVLTVPHATSMITEGNVITLDFENGIVENTTAGSRHKVDPLPGLLLDVLRAGGLFAQLEQSSLLRPARTPH